MKTSELTGQALDWAVAKCVGDGVAEFTAAGWRFNPSTNWAQGGPIIEREGIPLCPFIDHKGRIESWQAGAFEDAVFGTTPLIAAMRWYVASELGDEVEIPKGLL
jgi:hypothetical protein